MAKVLLFSSLFIYVKQHDYRMTNTSPTANTIQSTGEQTNRKTNMTLQQSLQLCQRRREMVDPIPAFIDQLKEYEKECRSWGYLTAVDQVKESYGNDQASETIGPSCNNAAGEKRKNGDCESGKAKVTKETGKKSRLVGPSIGPMRLPAKEHAEGGKKKIVVGPMVPPPSPPKKPKIETKVETKDTGGAMTKKRVQSD